jgi:integrase
MTAGDRGRPANGDDPAVTGELAPLAGTALPAAPDGPAPRDLLLARLTHSWLNRNDSVHTHAAYRRDLTYWLTWCQARELHPLDARLADVDDWLAEQRTTGVREGAPPSARRSIARRLAVVSSWYKYLIANTASDRDRGPLIAHNPADGANRPDVERDASPTTALSREEADRLIAAADADGLRSAALVRLLLTNAYRCMDMLGAQIEDLKRDQGHRVLSTTVKGSVEVEDALPPATARAIDAYLASRGGPETGPIFATRTGKPMDNGGLRKLLRRLCTQAGVPVISPHGGRKTALTEAIRTVGLRGAQKLGHHADPRTTGIYDAAVRDLDDHPAYVLATRYGVRHDE